jgi:hypothetical protein
MTPIRNLLNHIPGQGPSYEEADLVLGLPLESGSRTIYPVFLDPQSPDDEAQPRQIGYLELGNGRSDFTSLEPDKRPVAALPFLLLIIVVTFWLLRRSR